MVYFLAVIIGVVAGLRTMTGPAAVAWAAHLGWLHLEGTWAAFLGSAWSAWIFSVLACLEYVADQLPSTPSRTVPMQFGARLASGALCGAALGTAGGSWLGGLVAGVLGAVVGTYGGAAMRGRLAKAFGGDRPAGLLEDVVAILLGIMTVTAV